MTVTAGPATEGALPHPEPLRGAVLSRILIGEWIDMTAHRSPDLACFVMRDGSRRTYREVRERVHQLARSLHRRGVEKGDRIAILATDSPEYMEVVLALLKLGAVCVPLNYRLAPSEIELLMRSAQASWAFVGDRYAAMMLELQANLPYLQHVVGFEASAGTLGFDDLLAEGTDGETPVVDIDDEDILILAFTSGTTGLPKGVMQSHRMLKVLSGNAVLEYRILRDEFRYSASPLYHVAGMGLVLKCVVRGCTSLILPQWDPAELLPWFRKGLTGVFLVPTMISSLLEQPGVSAADFQALQSVFYGAAPMSPNLLVRAMELMNCDFYNGFGAGTEAGMQTVLTPEDHIRALNGDTHLLGSIGRPGYNIDLQIWDENGNEVARGEVGEIVTRSDMVMGGYLGQPEKTAESVVNGWFRGGDLAWQDEEGYLYLAGRKNDMIIRGGENVYPIEIETVIADYPGVVENAVIGVPDDHWGEVVRAHIVPAEGITIDVDDLRRFMRERLAGYKVPAEIRVEPTLPKNASGKILKRELRKWE